MKWQDPVIVIVVVAGVAALVVWALFWIAVIVAGFVAVFA